MIGALLCAGGAAGRSRPLDAVAPQLSFLHVGPPAGPADLPQILDSAGRSVLLRGVNVVGLRDSYVPDGSQAPPYPETPEPYLGGACPTNFPGVGYAPTCRADATQLAVLGYDSVRLPVSWSQLEPTPGQINEGYIARIAQVVGWLAHRGIYTIIDMHNDAWSKYVATPAGFPCPPVVTSPITGSHEADGAPAWASVHLSPVCAADGIRDLDPAVQEDFQRFYADLPGPDGIGLQEHYARVVAALAARFAGDPAVAGYDLMNEPEPGLLGPGLMDLTELFPFYAKVIATVRRTVPGFRQLFFIEPDVTRDVLDRSVTLAPWSSFSDYPNVVYAPHVYTDVFTPNAEFGLAALDGLYPEAGGYDSAAQDARTLGLPLWVGEFGVGIAQDDTHLSSFYQTKDGLEIGSSLWQWKCQTAGATPCDFSVMYQDRTGSGVDPSRVRYTDRAYPIYTVGTLQSMTYDPSNGSFTLDALARTGGHGSTVLYIPQAADGRVTVTGATVSLRPVIGGAREALVAPRGGAYSVRIAPAEPAGAPRSRRGVTNR